MTTASLIMRAGKVVATAAILIAALHVTSANSQCQVCTGEASPVCTIAWESGGFQPARRVVTGCAAGVTANWDQSSKSESCNASVPQGTALLDVIFTETNSNNGSSNFSRYTAGHLSYSQTVDDAYKSIYEMAVEVDSNYAATVKQDWDRHRQIAETYDSNMDSARLTVEASGSGQLWDQRRGWEVAKIDLDVVCVSPANLTDQLIKHLNFDNYAGKSKQYVSIYNDTGHAVYGLAEPLPAGRTSCADAKGNSSGFEVDNQLQKNFRVNDNPQRLISSGMCVVLGKTKSPGYADFVKACPLPTATLVKLSDALLADCFVN